MIQKNLKKKSSEFFFLVNLQNKNTFSQCIRIVASLQFLGKLSDQKKSDRKYLLLFTLRQKQNKNNKHSLF